MAVDYNRLAWSVDESTYPQQTFPDGFWVYTIPASLSVGEFGCLVILQYFNVSDVISVHCNGDTTKAWALSSDGGLYADEGQSYAFAYFHATFEITSITVRFTGEWNGAISAYWGLRLHVFTGVAVAPANDGASNAVSGPGTTSTEITSLQMPRPSPGYPRAATLDALQIAVVASGLDYRVKVDPLGVLPVEHDTVISGSDWALIGTGDTNPPAWRHNTVAEGWAEESWTWFDYQFRIYWRRITSSSDQIAATFTISTGVDRAFGGIRQFAADPGAETGGLVNLHLEDGRYLISYSQDGLVKIQRANFEIPPLALLGNVQTHDGSVPDTAPRLSEDPNPRRLRVVFTRGGASIMESVSDDDGSTWSTPVSLWASSANAKWGCVAQTQMLRLYAARVGGVAQGRLQYAGESAPGAPFLMTTETGASISIDDAAFDISPASDGPGTFVLVALQGGAMRHYRSFDDGRTWKEVV